MAANICISTIKGVDYLYGGRSERIPNGLPKRTSTCLGKIDPSTRELILNKNFSTWANNYCPDVESKIKIYFERKNIIANLDNIGKFIAVSHTLHQDGGTGTGPNPNRASTETAPEGGRTGTETEGRTEQGPGTDPEGVRTASGTGTDPEGDRKGIVIETESSAGIDGVPLEADSDAAKTLVIDQDLKTKISEDIEQEIHEFQLFVATFLLIQLIKKIGLFDILKMVFPLKYEQIITILQFLIIEKRSIMYCPFFANINYTISPPISVSSQRTSELFSSISENEIDEFYIKWSNFIEENDYLALDTTPISTFSKKNETAQFGKPKFSKSTKHLKQFNLCLLFGENCGLPVISEIYNGSLNDVSLLIDSVQHLEFVHHKRYKLVLDRGFYSKKNLNFMLDNKSQIPFIIGLPATTSLKKQLIEDHRMIFQDPNYAIHSPSGPLYGTTKRIKWDSRKYLYSHIFVDQNKVHDYHNEILTDYINMFDLVKKNPSRYALNSEIRNYINFRKSKISNSGYNISMNRSFFNHELGKAGWFVFLSNDIKDTEQAIIIYRRRDIVEKGYCNFKTRLGLDRPRSGQSSVCKSKYFIGFLSIIIISSIYKTMSENRLFSKYTIDEMLLILNTIRIIKIKDKNIISPLTAEQKTIYDYFKCPHPLTFSS
jgi:transposase